MGLEGAQWLWPQARFVHLVCRTAQFRRVFTMETPATGEARICVSGDRLYRLYLNGEHIASGPPRGFHDEWPYDEFTLPLSRFRAGENELRAEVSQPGVNTFGYRHEGSAGFILALEIGGARMVTDDAWQARFAPGVRTDSALLSIQLGHQEHVDARADSPWARPTTAPYTAMPWPVMKRAELPLLAGETKVARPVSIGQADADASVRPSHPNAALSAWSLLDKADFQPCASGRISGRTDAMTALVLDLGRVEVGHVTLRFAGGKGGETVDVLYHEVANAGKPVYWATPEAGFATRVVLKAGESVFSPVQRLGFRYATVCLWGEGEIDAQVSLVQEMHPYEVSGGFTSCDQGLNAIHALCLHTQRICSMDGYVDTPWREQGQWWGDARVQFKNTLAFARDVRLFAFGTEAIGHVQLDNGLTYGLAPSRAHTCILPDFTLQWIIGVCDLCRVQGSYEPYRQHAQKMERALAYFSASAPQLQGLIAYDDRYWLFLDWAEVFKNGASAMYNMWYLAALRQAGLTAAAAGDEKRSTLWTAQGQALEERIMRLLFDADRGLFLDGLGASTHGVHAQTLAILLGLAPLAHERMLRETILPFLSGKEDLARPSTYWTSYVCEAALRYGHRQEVAGFIRRVWTPMLPDGSCHEVAGKRDGRGSISHAWSAHPLYLLPLVYFGLDPLCGSETTVDIRPWLDDEQAPSATLVRPWGNGSALRVSFEKRGAAAHIRVDAPQGVTVRLHLPGGVREMIGSAVLDV